MVCRTVHSGRLGQGVKTKNALRLGVGNSLKKVNRDNKCSLKKVNRARDSKFNLKELHKESPVQAPKLQPQNQLAPRRQLTNSLLTQIDPKKASADELREAFCRDVDAFSFEFAQTPQQPASVAPVTRAPVVHDERPDRGYCKKVPISVCAVAYDSPSCRSGWTLPIAEGQLQFRFWSSYNKYRNDMDLKAVRAGCTFTGFSDSEFNGNSGVVAATQGYDRWVVFQRSPQYRHLDEDIESVQCFCGNPIG